MAVVDEAMTIVEDIGWREREVGTTGLDRTGDDTGLQRGGPGDSGDHEPHAHPPPGPLEGPHPRMAPGRSIARTALLVLLATALCLVLHLSIVSGLQHRASQAQAFASLRETLAKGTAPVAQTGGDGRLLPMGTPVALLEVRSLGLREVVGEGTTSGVLKTGPGHRRDSPLPGQAGTSVIFGRLAGYGGPFSRLSRVKVGATIKVTTGEGISEYRVTGKRRAGDPKPPPLGARKGRLQLVTATGTPFMPSGVLRIDADLVSETLASPPLGAGTVTKAEQTLAGDPSTAWALVLWLQALVVIAIAAVWSWSRWGRHQTWIVFLPLAVLTGLGASGQLVELLPNLL